jgi:hypothetical protein
MFTLFGARPFGRAGVSVKSGEGLCVAAKKKWLMRLALIACLGLITFLFSVFANGNDLGGISNKAHSEEHAVTSEAA